MKRLDAVERARIDAIIAKHLDRLSQARGFLGARAGFPIVRGELQREPAIVVYVRQKLAPARLGDDERLPRVLDGVPIDVMVADPHTQLELLAATPPTAARDLATAAAAAAARAVVAAAAVMPTYKPLPGDPIDDPFTIAKPSLCHVGPDSGWIPLRDFLAGTTGDLIAAMYDFNADYISNALIQEARDRNFPIKLALDDDIREQSGEVSIQTRLKERLGALYDAQVILCRAGGRFPSAYHEKVAIRDHTTFWLSSGNWTTSSQPNIDPIGDPTAAKGMYGAGNREWHVIVDDASLAAVFERYIEHDRQTALEDASTGVRGLAASMPDLFVPIDALARDVVLADTTTPKPVAPTSLPAAAHAVKVQPVLSPDNYAKRVTALIKSAKHRLYLQYAYINWTDADQDKGFRDLLHYLGEKSWLDPDDFDLRIIVGSSDAAEKVRRLAENGFNDKRIKSQSRIHNKGIVADGARVLISSQNWSGDGFLRNRDAGLIFHDEEIAGYYEQVFLDDWKKRARPPLAGGVPAMVAAPGERTPPGMVRMAWREYYGE